MFLVSPGGEIYSGVHSLFFFHIKLNCICIDSVHFVMLLELGEEAVAGLLGVAEQHGEKSERCDLTRKIVSNSTSGAQMDIRQAEKIVKWRRFLGNRLKSIYVSSVSGG